MLAIIVVSSSYCFMSDAKGFMLPAILGACCAASSLSESASLSASASAKMAAMASASSSARCAAASLSARSLASSAFLSAASRSFCSRSRALTSSFVSESPLSRMSKCGGNFPTDTS